jgi:hypothetical protein
MLGRARQIAQQHRKRHPRRRSYSTDQNQSAEFWVERCEPRVLLAGNVDVTVSGAGDLVVTGDSLAN